MAITISPGSVNVNINATEQFASTGASPVYWSVFSGIGSISNSGLYQAPATAGGAVVRVNTTTWELPASAGLTHTANDSLTISSIYSYNQSTLRLNNPGDYIEFVLTTTFGVELLNNGGASRAYVIQDNLYVYANHNGGVSEHDWTGDLNYGQTVRLELNSSNKIIIKVDGVSKVTLNDASASWLPRVRSNQSSGTIPPLKFNSSISGVQNNAASVTVVVPLSITSNSPLPEATTGQSYSEQLIATGGTGSLTWLEEGVISGIPPGLSISSSGLISGTPTQVGEYAFTILVEDSLSETDEKSFTLSVTEIPLPYGFTQTGIELFCEANQMALTNGANVTSLTDFSNYSRHLTATDTYPTFQTNVVNGKPVIRWNGSQKPLSNSANFTVRCGWIIAKYDGSNFPDTSDGYKGLLTGLLTNDILVGDRNKNIFFNLDYDLYEFRSNDRIYPSSDAPAPMSAFKLIFFRFWTDLALTGIQIGQQRNLTNRKWTGDVPLLILTSRDYCESDIRARSQAIASAYALTLADVYPYQSDKNGTTEASSQTVNFYDPPEGERISEVLDDVKRILDLKFTSRRSIEIKGMKEFHKIHYAPALPCIYRNYRMIPPEDLEGYIDSPYQFDGALNNFQYSFRFKEK